MCSCRSVLDCPCWRVFCGLGLIVSDATIEGMDRRRLIGRTAELQRVDAFLGAMAGGPAALILVGEYDVECPVPQSYEFWHALKTLAVPTQLVVYPKEGHGIGKPEHQRDIMKRKIKKLMRAGEWK